MKNSFGSIGKAVLRIGVLLYGISMPAMVRAEVITLKNNDVEIKITPDVGGRVVGFSIPGKPNILMVNQDKLDNPVKVVAHDTGFIDYFGHINWVSPQSEWWTRQPFDAERKEQRAMWPPDPYLIHGKTTVIRSGKNALELKGMDSPVSGLRFDKTFSLVDDRRGTVDLHVSATNITDADLSWGIWFNTRVNPFARVFVPVNKEEDASIHNFDPAANIPANFGVSDSFFSFEHGAMPSENKSVRSKAFIQPAEGWMAAFVEDQVFIIQFPLRAREDIHPEQGQVEIYHAVDRGQKNGMLEMELHAPYVTLKPGEEMTARERWTILPYDGDNARAAQLAFLQKLAKTKIIGNY